MEAVQKETFVGADQSDERAELMRFDGEKRRQETVSQHVCSWWMVACL